MAYYDRHSYDHAPRDRHHRPSSGYSKDYYYGDGPYSSGRPHQTGVVRRRDDSVDSIEEARRDYGGSGYEYGYGYPPPHPRRSRVSTVQEGSSRPHSMSGGRGGGYYDDSDYSRSRHSRRPRHHDSHRDRHRYDYRSPSSSRSPPRRRKSFSEQALGALGLGSAAAGASKHHDSGRGRSHGRHGRSYSYSPSRSRSRNKGNENEQRIAQAVKSALTAGAVEAFRVRKDPGEWGGEKGKRILTAAITAGGTDGLVGRDPNKHSKRHMVESTLAGLAANHLMNGSRSRSGSKHRGRSKSRGRTSGSGGGGLEGLAVSGALAAAGKEAYDRFRSRSRPRGRSPSQDSYGSSPRRSKKRSKSVSDYINRGMEALGLDEKRKEKERDNYRGHRSKPSRYEEYSDDDYDSDYRSRRHGSPRRSRQSRDVGRPPYPANMNSARPSSTTFSGAKGDEGHGNRSQGQYHDGQQRNNADEDSDPGNSTDEEKQQKKLTRQTLLASGLATVATIHAAHSLHGSVEKHRKRMEMVEQGEMSPEEARRRRLKGNVVDAASIGLAAMGINGALSEWKDVNAKRKERSTFQHRCKEKRDQRHRRVQSQGPAPRSSRGTYLPTEIEESPSEAPGRSRSTLREPSYVWN